MSWVKLHRKIMSSHTWANSSAEQKVILITLILLANHKETTAEINGNLIELKVGQFITSLQSIKDKAGKGVSIQNVRTALKRFKKLKFLTEQVTKHYRLITICKYDSYQAPNKAANIATNIELTIDKKLKNIKEYKEGVKSPLSIVYSNMMKVVKPALFIDQEEDLKRLYIVSCKIKKLIKLKKIKNATPYPAVSREEQIEGFKYLIDNLSSWELENRFFPEYILTNFSSIVNKIKSKNKPTNQEAPKLKASAFKNLR